jgi:hypothetical protein
VGADGPAGARTKQYVNGGDPGGGRPPGEGGFDYFDPERNNAGWWGECECRVIRVRLAGWLTVGWLAGWLAGWQE